jgi:hypothetical protein
MPRRIVFSFAIATLAVFLFAMTACAPKSDNQKASEQDAVAVDLIVDHDSLFGIQNNKAIGDIWFSDSVGLIGTPIRMVISIDDEYYNKFKDTPLIGTITLADPSVTKEGEFQIDFTLDENGQNYLLIVPQVKTVPTMLDFEVTLSAVNPDDENNYFQASLEYQFLINQGLPAT